jgi:hypothetical protein
MALISAPSVNGRFAQLTIAAILLVGVLWFLTPTFEVVKEHVSLPGFGSSVAKPNTPPPATGDKTFQPKPKPNHPIDHLIAQSNSECDALLAK